MIAHNFCTAPQNKWAYPHFASLNKTNFLAATLIKVTNITLILPKTENGKIQKIPNFMRFLYLHQFDV